MSDPCFSSSLRERTFTTEGWKLGPSPVAAELAKLTILWSRELVGLTDKFGGLGLVVILNHRLGDRAGASDMNDEPRPAMELIHVDWAMSLDEFVPT